MNRVGNRHHKPNNTDSSMRNDSSIEESKVVDLQTTIKYNRDIMPLREVVVGEDMSHQQRRILKAKRRNKQKPLIT